MYEATGRIHRVSQTKQVSERFSKREFVIETNNNPKYPQYVQFEATGDRTSALDGVSVGDEVRISFSVRGREWKSPAGEVKYFTTLDVYKVDVTKRASGGAPSATATTSAPDDTDIPF